MTDQDRSTFTAEDLQRAVQAGVLTEDAASAFQSHLRGEQAKARPDDENFSLVKGFNDVFVFLASVLVISGVAAVTAHYGTVPTGLTVAVVSIGLSEYFTRKMQLALSSILYAFAFSVGVTAAVLHLVVPDVLTVLFAVASLWRTEFPGAPGLLIALSFLAGATAAILYWLRYRVPIALAIAAFGLVWFIFLTWLTVVRSYPGAPASNVVLLLLGISVFLFAMYWDAKDPDRATRHSDIAFWLHIVSAPLIVHPIFQWVVDDWNSIGSVDVSLVLLAYCALTVVGLLVNRRAVIVGATAYLIAAIAYPLIEFSGPFLGIALALIIIGCVYLVLAVGWTTIRGRLVQPMPGAVLRWIPPAT